MQPQRENSRTARAIGYRGAMPGGKIPFDARNPDPDAVRQIVVERLGRDASWSQLDPTGDGFAPYVDYVVQDGRRSLMFAPLTGTGN
jgi:hypothetical protein